MKNANYLDGPREAAGACALWHGIVPALVRGKCPICLGVPYVPLETLERGEK